MDGGFLQRDIVFVEQNDDVSSRHHGQPFGVFCKEVPDICLRGNTILIALQGFFFDITQLGRCTEQGFMGLTRLTYRFLELLEHF